MAEKKKKTASEILRDLSKKKLSGVEFRIWLVLFLKGATSKDRAVKVKVREIAEEANIGNDYKNKDHIRTRISNVTCGMMRKGLLDKELRAGEQTPYYYLKV
jgi:hypothetical protein